MDMHYLNQEILVNHIDDFGQDCGSSKLLLSFAKPLTRKISGFKKKKSDIAPFKFCQHYLLSGISDMQISAW